MDDTVPVPRELVERVARVLNRTWGYETIIDELTPQVAFIGCSAPERTA